MIICTDGAEKYFLSMKNAHILDMCDFVALSQNIPKCNTKASSVFYYK